MSYDPLKRIQFQIAAKLRAESWFDTFPIFTVRSKTIETDISNALAGLTKRNGKTGLAISVLIPKLFGGGIPSGGPSEAWTTVKVQEIPEINFGTNGTMTSGEDVILRIQDELQTFNLDGSAHILNASQKTPLRATVDDPRLIWEFEIIRAITRTAVTRCEKVTITNGGGSITLTSGTASANIYYSTDADVFPSAPNGGTLYAAPFTTPSSGTTIYAAAYKTGLSGSQVTRLTV